MWPQRVLAVHTILGAQGLPTAPALLFRPTPGTPLLQGRHHVGDGLRRAQAPERGRSFQLVQSCWMWVYLLLGGSQPYAPSLRPGHTEGCARLSLYPSPSPEHGFSSRG